MNRKCGWTDGQTDEQMEQWTETDRWSALGAHDIYHNFRLKCNAGFNAIFNIYLQQTKKSH